VCNLSRGVVVGHGATFNLQQECSTPDAFYEVLSQQISDEDWRLKQQVVWQYCIMTVYCSVPQCALHTMHYYMHYYFMQYAVGGSRFSVAPLALACLSHHVQGPSALEGSPAPLHSGEAGAACHRPQALGSCHSTVQHPAAEPACHTQQQKHRSHNAFRGGRGSLSSPPSPGKLPQHSAAPCS
jgi:hypothetical protein